jgi:hypothetical protein
MPAKAIILTCVAVGVGLLVGLGGYAFSGDIGFGLVAFALVIVIVGAAIWK